MHTKEEEEYHSTVCLAAHIEATLSKYLSQNLTHTKKKEKKSFFFHQQWRNRWRVSFFVLLEIGICDDDDS